MAVAPAPRAVVVAGLFADVDGERVRREVVGEPDAVLVGGVGQLAALEHADGGDGEVLDAGVEAQPLVGSLLLLVVVDVGVAGVPTIGAEVDPPLEAELDLEGAGARDGERAREGPVFGAPLEDELGVADGKVYGEGAVGVEEGRAAADFEVGVFFIY